MFTPPNKNRGPGPKPQPPENGQIPTRPDLNADMTLRITLRITLRPAHQKNAKTTVTARIPAKTVTMLATESWSVKASTMGLKVAQLIAGVEGVCGHSSFPMGYIRPGYSGYGGRIRTYISSGKGWRITITLPRDIDRAEGNSEVKPLPGIFGDCRTIRNVISPENVLQLKVTSPAQSGNSP